MKKILPLFLCLLLLLPGVSAYASNTGVSLSLEKAGSFPRETIKNTGVFQKNGIILQEEEGYRVLDPFGEQKIQETYDKIRAFGDGLLELQKEDLAPNATVLAKSDGTILISEPFAVLNSIEGGDRYLMVSFATDQVQDKDQCYIFTSDSLFAFTPGDDDLMYDGYSKVFDLTTGAYVDGVEGKFRASNFHELDGNLVDKDAELIRRPDGSMLHLQKNAAVQDGYLFWNDTDNSTVIYDGNLNELLRLGFRTTKAYADLKAFRSYDGDTSEYHILNENGEDILEKGFSYVQEAGTFLCGETSQGKSVYRIGDWQQIFGEKEKVRYLSDAGYGFARVTFEDDQYALIRPDGQVLKLKEFDSGLCSIVREGDLRKVLVLEDGDYNLTLNGSASSICSFLIQNGVSLYSCIDGAKVLDGYQNYAYSNGYIYAAGPTEWEVFRLDITTAEVDEAVQPEETEETENPEEESAELPEPTELPVAPEKKGFLIPAIIGAAVLVVLVLCLILLLKKKNKKEQTVPKQVKPDSTPTPPKKNELPGGCIRILSGSLSGAPVPIRHGETLMLGSDAGQCNVVFPAQEYGRISPLHCRISYNARSKQYTVRDESQNHVYYQNGVQLQPNENISLPAGTVLCLADQNCIIGLE